jgi:GT2 family glycosyltransferase
LTKLENLGIVVIGRNEGQRLIDCLASLKPYTAAKIIYVDSGSADGSADAAGTFGAFVVRLDAGQPFTAARARNEGLAALLALQPHVTFVQFIDGDCELTSTWFDAALPFIRQREDVAVVCGRRRERYPEKSVYNRLCDVEWNTPIGQAAACGGDSLVRVKAFSEAGGFRPSLISGEEPELCGRIRERGWKIWRFDADMTTHDAAILRFSQWWRRAVRSGYGEAEIARLHARQGSAPREKREVARAVFWAAAVPVVIFIAAIFHPAAWASAAIYPLQIARIALRRGGMSTDSWIYALFMMIAKFAQLQGNLKYWGQWWRKQRAKIIEYK